MPAQRTAMLQALAHLLPIPKNLPIDSFFGTPAEAWALTIFGITLAPVMEEFLFRAFLYPVLKRQLGWGAAILLTALGFALLHGSQLKFAWGPLLVIFLVGLVLTIVRAQKNSVAASLLMHIAYNGTLSTLMFVATESFWALTIVNTKPTRKITSSARLPMTMGRMPGWRATDNALI